MCPPWASPSSSAPHASQWQGPYHARELKRAGLLSKGGIHGMQSRAERGSQSSTGNPWGKVCHVSVICGSRTSIQLSGGAMCGTATQPGFRLSQLSSPLTLKILYSLPLYPLPHIVPQPGTSFFSCLFQPHPLLRSRTNPISLLTTTFLHPASHTPRVPLGL